MSSLRLDWCSYEAARFACERWHYSRTVPRGRLNMIGVWEFGKYIGAVIFGHGATDRPSHSVGLSQWEACELQRVALTEHSSPVSRIVAIAMRMLKSRNINLRAVVSYADPARGHLGSIYQAGNWIYTGETGGSTEYLWRGEWVHGRSIGHEARRRGVSRGLLASDKRNVPGKFRYAYPLDAAMRAQIEPLRKPYPKRASEASSDAPPVQGGEDGAAPILTLQSYPDGTG